MQLNKVLKGLLIALPVIALSACSSTETVDKSAEEMNNANSGTGTESGVVTESVEKVESVEEIKAREMESLRQAEQVVYFEFDKSTIRADFRDMLSAHAAYLVKNPGQSVLIEGHADERGTPEYNIALSERRAKAVVSYLQASGVSSSQMSIVSYGEEKPLDKSRTEGAFAKNRRAVLVY